MANLLELTGPINSYELETLQEPLRSLQGNILRGHGRDYAVHIFLRFKPGEEASIKRWLTTLADDLTSAQQQLEETEQYRVHKIPGRLFKSFLLSASGYRYLFPCSQEKLRFHDEAFLCGMKAAQHRLNDPPTDTWEDGYKQQIDAMLLLADDDRAFLMRAVNQRLNDVQAFADIRAVEHGKVMWNMQGYPVEHFGFVDSRSQPLFFQSDVEHARQKGDAAHAWEPGVRPDVALVSDPYGKQTYDCGSYLVFRKLEQHVRDFKEREQQLAQTLGLTGEDAKRAGALVMGRFEDGTPVALQPHAGRPTNDFTYNDDPHGEKCPLQAHIRKVNARQPGTPHIVRRGITYGERQKEPKDHPSLEELPSDGVGLLFMCYQKSITQQFEVLQYLWANDPRVPRGQEPGIDPIIGQPGANGVGQQAWPARWNDARKTHKPFAFHSYVTLKGGEYFFAPSLNFLRDVDGEGSKSPLAAS